MPLQTRRSEQAKRLESAEMREEGLNRVQLRAFLHGAIESLTEVAAIEVRTERIQR